MKIYHYWSNAVTGRLLLVKRKYTTSVSVGLGVVQLHWIEYSCQKKKKKKRKWVVDWLLSFLLWKLAPDIYVMPLRLCWAKARQSKVHYTHGSQLHLTPSWEVSMSVAVHELMACHYSSFPDRSPGVISTIINISFKQNSCGINYEVRYMQITWLRQQM